MQRAESPPRGPRGGCGEKRHERSAGSGQGGTSVRNRGRKRPGSAQQLGRSPTPAQPCFPFPATQTHRAAPGRGCRDAEGGVRPARPPGLRFLGSHFLAAPGRSRLSARPSPGRAFCVSPVLPHPSPSSLSFLAISLRRARIPFLQASECPALPGFLAARLRLLRPPKTASREALGSPLAGPGLARWEKKGNPGVLPSARP